VIGGEYFAMWQSKLWNGEEVAFRIAATMLAALVFVSLPDGDNVGPNLGRHLRGMGDTQIGAAPSVESGPDFTTGHPVRAMNART
jgi:hypothetical protein